MRVYIYFSLYIILWSILYYLNLISYNPLYWLYIAIAVILVIISYLIYYNARMKLIFLTFLIGTVPKLIMVSLINNNNSIEGFMFGSLLFMIYLYLIDFDLYNIYYTQTTEKILNNNFDFYNFISD